jgi:hypothetical protein
MEINVARKPKTGDVKMIDDPTNALNPGLDPVPEAAPEAAPEAVVEAAPEAVVEAAPEVAPVEEAAPAPEPETVTVEIVTPSKKDKGPVLSAQTLLEMEAGRKALARR